MFGISGRPMSDGSKIQPLERFGVKLMSIGFLLEDPKAAVVWRGPMLHGALLQFLKDVDWGELDYLVLDLPPGTGDIALTLSQKVRSTGAVIVTTPQEVALQDVYKSVSMAAEGRHPDPRRGRERELLRLRRLREAPRALRQRAAARRSPSSPRRRCSVRSRSTLAVREWGDAGTPVVQAAPGSESAQAFVGHRRAPGRAARGALGARRP